MKTRWMQTTAIAVSVMLGVLAGGCSQPAGIEPAKQKAFATELLNRGLRTQAAEAFDKYVEMPGVPDEERAKVLFYVANQLTEAGEYRAALPRYLRLKSWYPDFKRMRDVESGIIRCFEKTGRSLEAQLALERSSSLKKTGSPAISGTVLAEIGMKKITTADFRREYNRLPPAMRKQLEGKKGKTEFLKQIVAKELFRETAVRRGLDKKADFMTRMEAVRGDLLVEMLIAEETRDSLKVSLLEIELYYKANKTSFKGPDGKIAPLDKVRQAIEGQVKNEKRSKIVQSLINRSLTASEVKLYAERLR
jgi:tetratricopeptide (TPR) repeat protein